MRKNIFTFLAALVSSLLVDLIDNFGFSSLLQRIH